jgi:hypothetical protein
MTKDEVFHDYMYMYVHVPCKMHAARGGGRDEARRWLLVRMLPEAGVSCLSKRAA